MWNFRLRTLLGDLKSHAEHPPVLRRGCDSPGCEHPGEYKAPKSRAVHDAATPHARPQKQNYYWFCIDHVRDYNSKWDYFKGMTQGEIERHLYKTAVWDRPTWRMSPSGLNEEKVRKKAHAHFSAEGIFGDFTMNGEEAEEPAHIDVSAIPHPTIEALAVMDLAPPVQWEEVKTRYKALAKKYHPDANKGDKKAEERFKKITLAYTILKLSYQNYTKLDER